MVNKQASKECTADTIKEKIRIFEHACVLKRKKEDYYLLNKKEKWKEKRKRREMMPVF